MEGIYVKIYDDYLVHHGTKGQRWGVRRYQNPDGSLTAAGKARYGIRSIRKSKDEVRKMITADIKKRKAKYEAKEKAKAEQKERQRLADIDRAMKTGPGAATKALNLSKEDLDRETDRYRRAADYMDQRSRVDNKINEYLSNEKSSLERKIEKASRYASTAADIANSLGKMYDAYSKITGKDKNNIEKYNEELKRLAVIEKKRSLGMEDPETKKYTASGKTSVADVIKNSNEKIRQKSNPTKSKPNKNGGSDGSASNPTYVVLQQIMNGNVYNR